MEKANIIFGLCGSNTDLKTVRIKLGRLRWEGRAAVPRAAGYALPRRPGLCRALQRKRGSCLRFDFGTCVP